MAERTFRNSKWTAVSDVGATEVRKYFSTFVTRPVYWFRQIVVERGSEIRDARRQRDAGGGEGKGNGAVVAFGFAFDSIERALSSLPAPRVCTKPEPRDTPVSASREPVDTIREAEAEKRSKPRYAASLGRRDWWPATGGQRADKER